MKKLIPKKLIVTNKSCKKTKLIILVSSSCVSFKFLIEKKYIKKDKQIPKIKE